MSKRTEIVFVLDRSGSMHSVLHDVIGGFNQFVKEQKAVPGECTMSLFQFDTIYEPVYVGKNIQEVEELTLATFQPRGSTALNDAVGRAIVETGAALAARDEKDRPELVLFCIYTDGHENASREYSSQQVKTLIEQQTDVYKWEFSFLGAGVDQFDTAGVYGIPMQNAQFFVNTGVGVRSAMSGQSSLYAAMRNS